MTQEKIEATDGEYYCKIREYQGVHGDPNPYLEGIWLERLTALAQKRRDIFDQLSRHAKYLPAFDALLGIPALFCGFRLTVIHHLISMRCEEVVYILYALVKLPLIKSSPVSCTWSIYASRGILYVTETLRRC